MTLTQVSKFLSLILRHKPEWIGITLDEHGWADVGELVKGISKETPFDETILEFIVRTDKKKRYQFNEDHTKIRACQGHSISVYEGFDEMDDILCPHCGNPVSRMDEESEFRPKHCPECGTKLIY